VNDIEQLQMMDLEEQLKFARNQVVELKKEIARLNALLNGEDVYRFDPWINNEFDKNNDR